MLHLAICTHVQQKYQNKKRKSKIKSCFQAEVRDEVSLLNELINGLYKEIHSIYRKINEAYSETSLIEDIIFNLFISLTGK